MFVTGHTHRVRPALQAEPKLGERALASLPRRAQFIARRRAAMFEVTQRNEGPVGSLHDLPQDVEPIQRFGVSEKPVGGVYSQR